MVLDGDVRWATVPPKCAGIGGFFIFRVNKIWNANTAAHLSINVIA
jgi:hypothetical protein